jgi:membrane protein YqaA with SNARE-associated domain
MTRKRWLAAAFAWGFAEATLFFLVPDVIVTLIAVRLGFGTGWIAAACAAFGAVVGGALIYRWAQSDAATVELVLDCVPAISVGKIGAVKYVVADNWVRATIGGGFVGTPYKLYAAAAGEQRVPLAYFLPLSFVARILRFLLTASLARGLAARLERSGFDGWSVPLLVGFWIVFYAWYLARTSW